MSLEQQFADLLAEFPPMRGIEALWDVLDNPSQYPASLVATVERWRERMIAALEEGVREALSDGQTEAASMLSRLLQAFHDR